MPARRRTVGANRDQIADGVYERQSHLVDADAEIPNPDDLRSAYQLEAETLAWNVVGTAVLITAAAGSGSVALIGFGLDSFLEIGASGVVIWELSGRDGTRRPAALRLIGVAFALLCAYLLVQSGAALITEHHADDSSLGLIWTGLTPAVMAVLALSKRAVGARLANEVVLAEVRVTAIDALLAATVLAGLVLNSAFGLWWADVAAGSLSQPTPDVRRGSC